MLAYFPILRIVATPVTFVNRKSRFANINLPGIAGRHMVQNLSIKGKKIYAIAIYKSLKIDNNSH